MKTSKELSNKPLISITEGRKLGEIKDLYLDKDMRQEGLINQKALMIERSAVQVYGSDVWLISGSDKVIKQDDVSGSAAFTLVGELRGREIQTEGGTKLGVVEDVILDDEARLLGFTLGKVYAQGPLAERKTIAREAVTQLGSKKEPMTIVLAQAESMALASH
jgi:sporulation protein YlmC with PRC-barrel domain